ncbi:hypothetical protein L484_012520 [Morus notabilis]|uniref:Late embryogenesis abundant protein LEA-2 subgroup domain-containing protein n=1 Tax=Morus notabilis TaxID=981085 RepID=W9QF55_9ROSA|nr:uncharacterized protein LOC21395729 [Morus notabilis]EXB32789.1 hypothetical protein L484_012520 [Morus notabilis]
MDHHHHHDHDHHAADDHDHHAGGDQDHQETSSLFHSYPNYHAYFVQSPYTVYSSNPDHNRNSTAAAESTFHSPARHDTATPIILRHDYSPSSRGSNNSFNLHHKKISYDARSHETETEIINNTDLNRLIIVDSTSSILDHHDDHDEDQYYYGEKSSLWKRSCSYENSDPTMWICLQISCRFLVSLSVALLVFYIATRPPPPKISIEMGKIGEFVLGEGVDASGVTTKILTCNFSLNLIIENKSKLFGLHVHPPSMEISFQRLIFAFAHGPRKLYAESGVTAFPLYIGTKNKALYGAGREMEDMLESGQGMPLMIGVKLSSSFRVVMNLIHPKFHHHARCLLLLHKPYDKTHPTHFYNSTCTTIT